MVNAIANQKGKLSESHEERPSSIGRTRTSYPKRSQQRTLALVLHRLGVGLARLVKLAKPLVR